MFCSIFTAQRAPPIENDVFIFSSLCHSATQCKMYTVQVYSVHCTMYLHCNSRTRVSNNSRLLFSCFSHFILLLSLSRFIQVSHDIHTHTGVRAHDIFGIIARVMQCLFKNKHQRKSAINKTTKQTNKQKTMQN